MIFTKLRLMMAQNADVQMNIYGPFRIEVIDNMKQKQESIEKEL